MFGHRNIAIQKYVKWGIFWRKPGLMITFLLLSIIFMLGNHIFYNYLNGVATANRTQWSDRIRTVSNIERKIPYFNYLQGVGYLPISAKGQGCTLSSYTLLTLMTHQ